jgi:hypothetical protein
MAYWLKYYIRRSNAIVARSCEAGRAIQCVRQPRCLKKEREHRRLSARAPSDMKQFLIH